MTYSRVDRRQLGSPSRLLLAALAFALIPVLGLSLHAQPAASDGALQQKLEGLRKTAMNAWQSKDAATLTNTMAEDFQFIGPYGVLSREMWLGGLTHCSVATYSIVQEQLKSLTPDSALLIFRLDYSGDCDGATISVKSMVTDTFVRRDGRWWIVNTTLIPLQN